MRWIILFAALLLSGCGYKYHKLEESVDFGRTSFKEYAQQGFLFTPFEYRGDYESLGYVEVEIYPETEFTYFANPEGERVTPWLWVSKEINGKVAFDLLHLMAKELGADAIVDLKMVTVNKRVYEQDTVPGQIEGMNISGLAIKRKGAFK